SVIAVGATTKAGDIAAYSNLAPSLEATTLLAPGGSSGDQVCSSTTFASPGSCSNPGTGGPFTTKFGTSMATPFVTGAWAVLKQAKPGAGVDEVLSALRNTGQRVVDPATGVGYRQIQIADAVDALVAAGGSGSPSPLAPPSGNPVASVTLNRADFH